MQERCYLCKLPIALGFGPRPAGYCKCPISAVKKPPCDCGNENASWHGDHCGRREYCCDKCFKRYKEQLAEARAEIERINHQRRAGWTEIERLKLVSQNQETVIAAQRRSAKAKDKLIEQMRDTLKHVRKYSCSHMQRTTHDMIDAALSAAERGE